MTDLLVHDSKGESQRLEGVDFAQQPLYLSGGRPNPSCMR